MAGSQEPSEAENEKDVRFKFSTPVDVTPAEQEPAEEDDFVYFCTVPAGQAARVCTRLEQEGIPSNASRLPEAVGAVKHDEPIEICVPNTFLETAREIVTQVEIAQPDDDIFNEGEGRNRLIEDGWCPACGKQKLVNLPRSSGWRFVRRVIIGVLLVPVFVGFVLWSSRSPAFEGIFTMPWWPVGWIVTLISLTTLYLNAHREKQCEECGWRTDDPADASQK